MRRRKMCFNRSLVVLSTYVGFVILLFLILNTLYPHANIVPKQLSCTLRPRCSASQQSASYWFAATNCASDCNQDALNRGDKNPGNVYSSCFDGTTSRCVLESIDVRFPAFNAIVRAPLLATGYTSTAKLSPCSLFGSLLPKEPQLSFPYFDIKARKVVDASTCTQKSPYPKFACLKVNAETNMIDVACYKTLNWTGLKEFMFDYQYSAVVQRADMNRCSDIETLIGSALPYEKCSGRSTLFCKTDTGISCYSNPTD